MQYYSLIGKFGLLDRHLALDFLEQLLLESVGLFLPVQIKHLKAKNNNKFFKCDQFI